MADKKYFFSGSSGLLSQTVVSYFSDFYDNSPIEMSLQDCFHIVINDGKLRDITEGHRKQKAICENVLQTGTARAEAKKLAKNLKQKIPVVIPGAICENGKSRDSIKCLNPIMGIDIDHIGLNRMQEVKDGLYNDPSVVLALASPSGLGMRAFYYIDNIESIQKLWNEASNTAKTAVYKFAYMQVANHVEEIIS